LETKKCSKCNKEFPNTVEYFYQRKCGRVNSDCKTCVKTTAKQYYFDNKTKVLNRAKSYYTDNKEMVRKYQNSYRKKRCKEDHSFRIFLSLRSRLVNALKGKYKTATTEKLLGCSREELIEHLESQFTENMNWGNYGRNGWQIDHTLPCSDFDLSSEEQQKKCFHYTNLRPLWAEENLARRFN